MNRSMNGYGHLIKTHSWSETKLMEKKSGVFPNWRWHKCPANDETKAGLQFVRDFYRGSSGYADHIAPERLSLIHLKTRLDSAIIDAAKNGKDIVLTGNPGDGKTHIIRIIKPALEKLGKPSKLFLMPVRYQIERFLMAGSMLTITGNRLSLQLTLLYSTP